ncbi:MAG: hypothetical protein KF887_16010 [Paracoccaceae bacterium]|nr:MAG: hypothetical protein KF887_16010 [Paracoccaceae bacterium]
MMSPKYLVIGMSHVGSLLRATSATQRKGFTIVNLRHEKADIVRDPEARKAMAEKFGLPDVLCLALEGNFHNVIALLNDPEPFFMVPSIANGHFIPRDMMRSHMELRHQRTLRLAKVICEMFPARLRIVLDPPPPAGDEAHIRRHPGIFADKIDLGLSPTALRIAAYQLQSDLFRNHAKELGAEFLPSPSVAHDENGMLASRYWNNDPTHGNAAYGSLVLDQIEELSSKALGESANA